MTWTNLTLQTDSYKLGHHEQYPPGTEHVYSYYESRGGSDYPYTVFFGLQYYLKHYLEGVRVTHRDIDEGIAFCKEHFGGKSHFNEAMWRHIVDVYNGALPIEIRAVPEGTIVPTANVLMTITNTDPKCAPLVNHLETLLCNLWYPCNVATLSRLVKHDLRGWLKKNSDVNTPHLDFMLHDFGMRGAACPEAAALGGAAHLVNFLGTDTVAGIRLANDYYGAGVCGFSVPATEHSVMTARGRSGEFEVVQQLLDTYPSGILSVVSDSYDIEHACKVYGTVFKDQIMARDGKFVVRPDSGHPTRTVIRCLEILEEYFPCTTNNAGEVGYTVLPEQVGLIWGDGIDREGINDILRAMDAEGYSSKNIVFGMGGGLLQKHNRDTQRFAFKASSICINSVWSDIFKDPVAGRKESKSGRMKLVWEQGEKASVLHTVDHEDPREDQLMLVFRDGEILEEWPWHAVQLRAEQPQPGEVYEPPAW